MRPASPLTDVAKIAWFRPSAVGDFIFALPALHALRETYPKAEITYLGRPWHQAFLAGRPGPVDRVEIVPPLPGIGLPVDAEPSIQADDFLAKMKVEAFDLVLQAYGGGRFANPLVKAFGARHSVGMRAADASPLDRWLCYRPWQNRRLQLLELAALAGAGRLRLGQELEATDLDRQEAATHLPGLENGSWVVIQPGASDARRRWAAARFAAVGDALAKAGAAIAVHGSAGEEALVREVIASMKGPAINLGGLLSLSGLCGLLSRAALLISNDTGPLHMAVALGTPCVGIYWFGNLIESGPLLQEGHRAAVSARVRCPVCGEENLRHRCAHDVSFVDDVEIAEVIEAALALFKAAVD